jgi:hypothetical protein
MDLRVETAADPLPPIPVIGAESGGVAAVAEACPREFRAVLDAGRGHYGAAAIAIGDRLSRRWLGRNQNPYLPEIDALAGLVARAGGAGVHLLNMSYEWTCTTSAAPDPAGDGARLLRTLDWPLHGLGRNVVVARMKGAAGTYDNVTWPGFSGIATASAPGRFAAAINQPPMRKWTSSCWFDWGVNRMRLWRRRALPPVHLLRHVFDTCRTFDEAKWALSETPIAMPAFFTLAGTRADEACVIERTEDAATLRKGPASIANHWIARDEPGRYRGFDSPGRYAQMEAGRERAGTAAPFDWVTPPILNATTRLAVVAHPASGRLCVQGWEHDGPATAVHEGTA